MMSPDEAARAVAVSALLQAGISARGRTVSEADVDVDDFEDYVVDWPLTVGERAGEKERT